MVNRWVAGVKLQCSAAVTDEHTHSHSYNEPDGARAEGSVAPTVGNLKPQTFVSVSAVHAITQSSAIPWNVLLELPLYF